MTVEELVFSYSTEGAEAAARADDKVKSQVEDTASTARQETGSVERWMTANRTAIESIGTATAGVMGAILAASPTVRAELSGIRMGFTLFADTIVQDVLPASGSASGAALDMAQAYRELPDPVREGTGVMLLSVGAAGAVAFAFGAIPGVFAGAGIAVLLLADKFGTLDHWVGIANDTVEGLNALLEGDVDSALDHAHSAFDNFTGLFRSTWGRLFSWWFGFIGDFLKSATEFGVNLVSNLASGITDAAPKVWDAITDTVSGVSEMLPNSPARKGPLSQEPDFASFITDPIDRASGDVTGAMRGVAGGIAGNGFGSGGGSGRTTNITIERGAIVVRGGASPRETGQQIVDEVSEGLERRMGGRGI